MKTKQYTCKDCGKSIKMEITTTGHDMMALYNLCKKCYIVHVKTGEIGSSGKKIKKGE